MAIIHESHEGTAAHDQNQQPTETDKPQSQQPLYPGPYTPPDLPESPVENYYTPAATETQQPEDFSQPPQPPETADPTDSPEQPKHSRRFFLGVLGSAGAVTVAGVIGVPKLFGHKAPPASETGAIYDPNHKIAGKRLLGLPDWVEPTQTPTPGTAPVVGTNEGTASPEPTPTPTPTAPTESLPANTQEKLPEPVPEAKPISYYEIMQGLNPSLLYDDGTKSPIQILHDYYTFLSAVRSMDISGPPNHSQFNPAALRKQAACLELIYGKGGIPDAEWTYIGRPSPDGRIPYDDMGDNLSDIRQGLAADNVKLKGFAGFQERPWGGKQNDDIQHNPHTDPILDQTSYIGVPQLLKVILDAPDGGDGRRLTLHYTVYECDPTSHAYGTKYLADTYTSSKDLTLTLLRRDAPTRQGIHWMWSTAP